MPPKGWRKSLESRYIPEPNTGCWIWLGNLDVYGYGRTTTGTHETRKAHRVIYELHRGPIPEGMTLDHLCRQRCCVNPDHLEVCTFEENLRRGWNHRKGRSHDSHTRCWRGHEWTAETMYRGKRDCVLCRRQAAKERRHGKLNAAA